MFSLEQIATITQAQILQQRHHNALDYLLTDSRKIVHPANSLFFAIKGAFNNGHKYVTALYAQGVRVFVIENVADILETTAENKLNTVFPEASFLLVESGLRALQKLTSYHRSQFTLPVIGITGSNGKTIVKEWLAQLLSLDERVVKSPRSYNSQIGVPLSVWQLNQNYTLGIFEAGISKPGEMTYLEDIIKPTIGIFTNIGPAHNEGFTSIEQKIQEKLILFKNAEILFYCRDQEQVHTVISAQNIPTFTWSRHQAATLEIVQTVAAGQNTILELRYAGEKHSLLIPFADEASLENITHCLAFLLWRKTPVPEIQERISRLTPVAMRLEMKEAINGCYLIDDTYNNDLAGLAIALDLLQNQPRLSNKTLILSDLLETGLPENVLYEQVSRLVKAKQIDKFIGVGPQLQKYQHLFQALPTAFYESTQTFLQQFNSGNFQRETILIKGARVFEFEKVVAMFQRKVHGTVLEVNLDALVHNLNYYRSKLAPQTRIMVMVKAFAYGSGSYEIANLLQFHRVDYLAVAYTDEGVQLREHGITLPIMVMNPSPDSFAKIQQYQLEPEIYSFEILEACLKALDQTEGSLAIHIKLDTGMHRLGFTQTDLPALLAVLKNNPAVSVLSCFSHLAGADEALHNDFSRGQITAFRRMASQLETSLGYSVLKHILNSAGIIRFPEDQLDMVRLGIGLYGVEASGLEPEGLRTVGTLKTTVSQVKKIAKGDTIGYSRKGLAEEDKQIATIAIGYADGYDRRFSNGKGWVLINGKLVPIIGNVCMDMCMVDVTGLPVRSRDEVIIFGTNPTISDLAQQIGTIPYELLTNVSARVKRVFYSE